MSTVTAHTDHEDDDPFLITSMLEVQSLLRSLEEKGAMLRMHIEGRTVAIITTILEVDPDTQTVIVDNSTDEDFNRRIASAEKISFETNLDKVRIQFSVPRATPCLQNNLPALQVPFPESIRRVQRREYYRVDIPVSEPASCSIKLPADAGGKTVKFNIKDISAGGISVLDNDHLLDNAMGTVYADCQLDLPDAGTVITSLRIMRSLDEQQNNGKATRLLGCKFFNLSNPMIFIIQQYIGKLERKLNAKRRGFE
ncbi:flagellar brake protein [Alcaligenaceae bacterium]|nr:flagellar brake protein [Alcaligenaceae bacterium]